MSQHLTHQQRQARASGEFSTILSQIALAGKIISRTLSCAGVYERRGYPEGVGSPDQRKRMDEQANDTFVRVFNDSPYVSTLVSEDLENPLHLHDKVQGGKYIVCVDPLDRSANLDCNGVIGSIFSILRRVSTSSEKATEKDLLQRGTEQVAAGYMLYGPRTMLVYSVGNGVHAYTMDKSIGEFLITRENIRIPERGLSYACDESKYHDWHEGSRRFIDHLRQRDTKSEMHYSAHFAGTLVADFHRTLIEGGVYLSPSTSDFDIGSGGKQRLIYECNPLAFIVEHSSGRQSDHRHRARAEIAADGRALNARKVDHRESV